MGKLIKSVEELKDICEDIQVEFFVALNGGLRSSKIIEYDTHRRKFEILNEIDNTQQVLTENQLFTESNIGEAILKEAFYQYT